MGILDEKSSSGRKKTMEFILLHGVDGVGKTTIASQAPAVIIVGPEDGSSHIDLPSSSKRRSVESWTELLAVMTALVTDTHKFQSFAADSVDWIEALLWQHICAIGKVDNIEQYEGGYGKGYTEAQRHWREFVALCQKMRTHRNMNVILIAHSFIKTFQDPLLNTGYDRYILKVNDKCAAILRESVECVLFAIQKTAAVEVKGTKGAKSKAFDGGSNVLYTERRPSFDAKNRYGLPFEIPFGPTNGWAAIQQAKAAAEPDSLEMVKKECENLLTMLAKDDELVKTVTAHIAEVKDDLPSMVETRKRLRELTQQK